MSSIAPTTSFIISGANYTYPIQLPLSVQIPANAQSYTVTPPESTASGGGNVRGRHEDVGRLSDMEEDGENINASATKEKNIQDEITILEEDENSSPAAAVTTKEVKMVNIRPNGKITVYDPNSSTSKAHPSSLAYVKEVMKDIGVGIHSPGNLNELIVLQGADDGVAVHRSVITYYSKFVEAHVRNHPDCSSVFLPFLSQAILQKVVTLLYYGECFFTNDDKKSVNLVWEAMRYLQINFDDTSFFCHAVEFSGVKEEVEDVEDQTKTPAIDPAEVDQTDELWYEEDNRKVNVHAFEKVVRLPHPTKPNKTCASQTNYGVGVRIRRALPAMRHINGDEIQLQEILEGQEETIKLLEKNRIPLFNLSDNEEDDDCPTPPKKSRIQSYPASTSIVRDEEFKRLFESGKVNLNMIKGANCKKPDAAVPSSTSSATIDAPAPHNYPLCSPPAPFDHEDQQGDVVISANIPANNPDRTGITIMQPSASPTPDDDLIKDEDISPPPSPSKSISGMPILQLATSSEPQVPKRRTVHARSLDITEGPIPTLPTLDKMMIDDEDNQETLRENEFFPDKANSATLMLLTPAPAAIIPKSKVNNFLPNRQIPSTSASMASQMENVGSGQRTPKRRRTKTLPPPSPDVVETTAEMRVAYAQEEELKNKCFIVASKKIPVPDDLREDNIHYYVENMESIDDELINSLPESSRAILSRHKTTSETQLVADTPAPRGKRGRKSPSERGTGRGRGRPPKITNLNLSYPDVTMTEVETGSQANVSNQPGSSGQAHPVRSRGRGRRGSRGGGRGK